MADPSAPSLPASLRLWALAAGSACLLPLLVTLPAGLALALAGLAAMAFLARRPLPAWLRTVLLAMAAGLVFGTHGFGVGRDTGCALLAAMLALKMLEVHTPRDALSLLGFSLFGPFAAFLQDQGPLVLAMAIPGVLALLSVLAMLAELQGGGGLPEARPRRRLRAGATRIALVLPLAAAGFWLFPRLGSPLWGMPENALQRPGIGEEMTPDRWVDLFADDAPAMRVQFDGPMPARDQLYWRAQVLVRFDGRSWFRGTPPRDEVPALAGPAPAVGYRITLEPTDREYLVTLDLPTAAPEDGVLQADGTVLASSPVTRLLDYRAVSRPGTRIVRPLAPWERREALRLPPELNPRTRALAAQWRADLGADDAALVQRALDWIAGEFSYSLTVPPTGRNGVDEFLFEHQVGFCQHYSSAFAVLMRSAGIPTRVVLGYAGGVRNPFGQYWQVRNMDAHAWNEVWIEGRGWLRVDPTAAVAPERVLDTVEDLARRQSLLPEALTPVRDIADWVRRGWNEMVLGFNAVRQASLLRPLGIDQASGRQLVLAFAVGAALAVALTLWWMLRGQRGPRDPVLSAWRRFTRRLARAGVVRAPWEPAIAFGGRAGRGRAAAPRRGLSRSRPVAAQRYAPPESAAADRQALIADLLAFRPRGPSR